MQFVHCLMKLKKQQLAAKLPSAELRFKQDLLLDIELEDVEPCTWRRFRVSGGITLRTLQDKVVAPLTGWVRHGYQFFDRRDGAAWGPENSSAIDMMHMAMNGFDYLDDRKTRLAEILQAPGDEMGYMHDMGDHWFHDIRLVSVFPPEESTGRCEVIDGAMACPPEDSSGFEGMGNRAYQDFLHDLLAAKANASSHSQRKFRKLCAEATGALNYKDRPFHPEAAWDQGFEYTRGGSRRSMTVCQGEEHVGTLFYANSELRMKTQTRHWGPWLGRAWSEASSLQG